MPACYLLAGYTCIVATSIDAGVKIELDANEPVQLRLMPFGAYILREAEMVSRM